MVETHKMDNLTYIYKCIWSLTFRAQCKHILISNSLRQYKHEYVQIWLGTGTSVKGGGVKLDDSSFYVLSKCIFILLDT